jgi:U3 small nucleolar RNA-associated protein 19
MGGQVADKPRLLRRQDDDRSQQNSSEHSLNQSPARTMKERHENYMKAREELGLGNGPQDGMGAGRGGRGGPGGRFGIGGRMDGGRGRKAVFRDKDKDLSDPDYRRGMNRCVDRDRAPLTARLVKSQTRHRSRIGVIGACGF